MSENHKDIPQINVMEDKVQAILNQYSTNMRNVIKDKVETITKRNLRETEKIEEATKKDSQSKQNEVNKFELQIKRDQLVTELLERSNDYMEKNMNAVANNMSLLSLHSFELGYQVEK